METHYKEPNKMANYSEEMVIKDCYHAFNLPLGEMDNSMKRATTNIQYSM